MNTIADVSPYTSRVARLLFSPLALLAACGFAQSALPPSTPATVAAGAVITAEISSGAGRPLAEATGTLLTPQPARSSDARVYQLVAQNPSRSPLANRPPRNLRFSVNSVAPHRFVDPTPHPIIFPCQTARGP